MAIRRTGQLTILTALLVWSCGGKAVIDQDGTGGATSSNNTTTTTTMAGPTTNTTTGPTPTACAACENATIASAGAVANVEITEASGIAASRVHDDVYYVHNDSGGAPRFFAMDSAGNDLGSFVVNAAAAVDWEDIATGPCDDSPQESCIYLADIGDNPQNRASYTIYRTREPASIGAGQNINGDAFSFTYPDGSHNAEALLADPATGTLFIVTKSMTSAGIYRFPDQLVSGTTVTYLGDAALPAGISIVTGGSAHERGVLLRTFGNILLFEGGGDIPTNLSSTGCVVPAPGELQGEAVTWRRPDGMAYLTVAEGSFPAVYEMTCQF